jgi:hypothetical protein
MGQPIQLHSLGLQHVLFVLAGFLRLMVPIPGQKSGMNLRGAELSGQAEPELIVKAVMKIASQSFRPQGLFPEKDGFLVEGVKRKKEHIKGRLETMDSMVDDMRTRVDHYRISDYPLEVRFGCKDLAHKDQGAGKKDIVRIQPHQNIPRCLFESLVNGMSLPPIGLAHPIEKGRLVSANDVDAPIGGAPVDD